MTAIIKLYQLFREVKHAVLWSAFGYSSVCKHTPTCSDYARHQIAKHGTIWGSAKAIIRIAQCW